MKKLFVLCCFIVLSAVILSSCGGESLPASITLESETLTLSEGFLSATLPTDSDSFDFAKDICVEGADGFTVSTDASGENVIDKLVPLEYGENLFYIHVGNGDGKKTYTAKLVRPRSFTVSFEPYNDTVIPDQEVEEGKCATVPTEPVRLGYSFCGWSLDLSQPITEDVVIKAKWSVIPEMEPFAFRSNATTCVVTGFKDSYYNEITIPDCVTHINDHAFDINHTIKKVTLGKGLISIGNYAFAEAKLLEHITVPGNVKTIGEGAFANCIALTSAIIENGAESIGRGAFCGCYNLEKLAIPFVGGDINAQKPSNKTLLYYIFCQLPGYSSSYTKSVTQYLPNGETIKYEAIEAPREIFITGGPILGGALSGIHISSLTITEGIDSIEEYTFYKSRIGTLSLPGEIKRIGNSAFENAVISTPIALGEAAEEIGNSAFYGCRGIQITLGSGLTAIPDFAFARSDITELNIPKGITSIKASAFIGLDKISLSIDEENTSFKLIDGSLFTYDGHTLVKFFYNGKSSYTIPSTVNEILSYSFAEAAVYEVCMSEASLTAIPAYAFYKSAITTVSIPEGITAIGNSAFRECADLTDISLPDSLRSISDYAFLKAGGARIRRIIIPLGIESIGNNIISSSSRMKVLYEGTEEDLEQVNITDRDQALISKMYFFSEDKTEALGKFWRYAEDGSFETWNNRETD
ncbi:MAG: leucine-rich repeat protein [Clostridia bacterium]|nr:leucine-rich repeat protein [Clostridia bacterium]